MPERTSPIRLRIFGGLHALRSDAPLDLGGRQQRTLLALLAVHRPDAVPLERLVDLLWPDAPPATAPKVIQVQVLRLRGALGPNAIESSGDGYRLSSDVSVQTDGFERDVVAALELIGADPLVSLSLLEGSLRDASGEPFATEADLEPLRFAATRLREIRWQACEARLSLLIRLRRFDAVLRDVERLIAEDPIREPVWSSWIRSLAATGRRAEALRVYRRAVETFRAELGVEPDEPLATLGDSVAAGRVVLDEPVEPAFATLLPALPSSFIGRVREKGDLVERARPGGGRLTTVVGSGGIGKTRVVIETARELRDAFAGAVAYVDLAAVATSEDLWPGVGSTLGLQGGLTNAALHRRRGLLVLDNPERIPSIGAQVAALLEEAPNLQLLVASRVPLRVVGEQVVTLDTLLPDEAIALFEERAAAAGAPDADLAASSELVPLICARVDRLPLAIELAALQLPAMGGRGLLDALGRRLPVLVGGPHGVPDRHRTIEATIAWSDELLDEDAKRLLGWLSVFEGGWTWNAAEFVCEATAGSLQVLIDASLVMQSGDRMSMLDTVHEYAAARLAETPAEQERLLRRHADYFLGAAIREEAECSPEHVYRVLASDVPNQRVAMASLLREPTTDRALEFATALWMTLLSQGRIAEGDQWFESAQARLSSRAALGRALCYSGEFARARGDLSRSERVKLESVALLREPGSERMLAATLTDLAEIARARSDLRLARQRAEEALALRRRIGLPEGIIHAVEALADIEADEGNLDAATALLEEGMRFIKEHGRISRPSGHFSVYVPLALARVRMRQGQTGVARILIYEGLEAANLLSMAEPTRSGLQLAARWLVEDSAPRRGDTDLAAILLGAADGIAERDGFVQRPAADIEAARDVITDVLGSERASEVSTAGAGMNVGDVVGLALRRLRRKRRETDVRAP